MSILPKYKDIIDLIKKGSTIEAQEKIMELREAAIQLQDENQVLRDKIRLLEKELEGTNTAQRPRLGGGIMKTITEVSELRPPL